MSWCNKYIGIPYVHQGRTLQGLDCWGLPILVYRELFGIELLDFDNYTQDWAVKGGNFFIDNYSKMFEQTDTPELNCIVFFKNRRGVVHHAGIYIGEGKFVQCIRGAGVVISRLSAWKEKIQGYYRLKK